MDNEIERLTYSLGRKFVTKENPRESEFYDLIWNALQEIPPRHREGELKEKKLTIIESNILGQLVTPLVIGIVSGVLSRFFYDLLKRKREKKKIDKSTKVEMQKYAIQIEIKSTGKKHPQLAPKVIAMIFDYFEDSE